MRSAPTAPSIAGHQFVRLISGRGGFGDVYLYRELALDRDVAIKVIRDPSLDANSRAKFEAEAKAMAALEHPNVVRIYAIGQTREGHPYISMMFCPSPTMAERSVGGRLPLHDVLTIGVVVASAVESAHRAGVIHRDLKPANILTMPGGAPGLTDFGVAASLEADADDDDAGDEHRGHHRDGADVSQEGQREQQRDEQRQADRLRPRADRTAYRRRRNRSSGCAG